MSLLRYAMMISTLIRNKHFFPYSQFVEIDIITLYLLFYQS